jgi:hypothetical protein
VMNGKNKSRHERETNGIQSNGADVLGTGADGDGSDTLSYCLPGRLLTSYVLISHCSVFSP